MKNLSYKRLFFVTLLSIFCPSIFTHESKNIAESSAIEVDKNTFEQLMVISRKHTEEIGWSAQQILQTLCNNKEQFSIQNKQAVIETLKEIQDITRGIDRIIATKNTWDALICLAIYNNGLIHFLSKGLKSNFKDFNNFEDFFDTLQTRSNQNYSNEIVLGVIDNNIQNIEKLLIDIGSTGLTWYNLLHRKMKALNVYDAVKKTALVGAGLTFAAFCYCRSNTNPDGKFFFSNWTNHLDFITSWADRNIGSSPVFDREHGCYKYQILDSNGSLLTSQEGTPFTMMQAIVTKEMQLSGSILSLAPLYTINLAAIANYCFGDTYDWTKNKYNENINNFDQFLNGSLPNQNITDDGQEKVYFNDLIGCDELEALANQLADFVEHPEYYERSKTETHRGILLHGPPQTGKSNFAKALRTLIQERIGDSKKMGFIDGKSLIDRGIAIEDIFNYASYTAPCIIFLDEIDLIGGNREKNPENTGKLLTCMQGIDISSKQVIVIGATNRVEQLDKALLVDGRFGKQIFIDYPEYKYRKQFFQSELEKRAIALSDDFIDHMAQETDGCSYNNLRRIITEAIIISANERRLVCEADFEKTLDTDIRKIYFGSRNKSSDDEKRIIASYQAGKALARQLFSTDKQIVKVTIEDVARVIKSKKTGFAISMGEENSSENKNLAPEKNESKIKLGEVFAKSKNNKKDLVSDQEIEKECLILLAGHIAQRITFGKTYSQCNKHDRAEVMQLIYESIAQGEKIDDKIRAQALIVKDTYEKQIFTILEENKELLEKIMNTLIEKTTLDRYQWSELIS